MATIAPIVATTAIVANSAEENQFLVFVGEEFFFGHNRENNRNEFEEISRDRNLSIDLGHFPWATISYRLGKDFRSGRYRHNLGLACT